MNESMAAMKIEGFNEHENIVHSIALKVLIDKKAIAGKGVALKDLLPAIQKNIPHEITDFNIYKLLRKADQNPESRVKSGGPWRGYFLADEVDVITEPANKISVVGEGENKFSESDLYPLVSRWLREIKEYKRVSSQYAYKRGGAKWQNPDVIALNPIEQFGLTDIEIVTCEVKPFEEGWQRWILEAVAHRLRADRSYFIFRSKNPTESIDPEIYSYAEKFKVGVAVIVLPDEKIKNLKNFSKLSDNEQSELLDAVVEIIPAPKENINIKDKIDFLSNIGILSKENIYMFGER